MANFDSISVRSKRFFDYLVNMEMEKWPGDNENGLINKVFETIETTKHEYFLEDDFIYRENLKVTRKLIRQRMKEIRENRSFLDLKGIV